MLDKWREDPQASERFGAIVTYDLDLTRDRAVPVLRFSRPLHGSGGARQASDCGFVPGTGWPEPGGFLPREV